MLEEIKEKLINEPEHIIHILENFNFSQVRLHNNEIRCAFEDGKNPTAIVMRLQNNDNCFIKDYTRNVSYDLITYLVKEKGIPFKEVLNVIKKELGITDIYNYHKDVGLFGGLYNQITQSDLSMAIKIYPEDTLNKYKMVPNSRWLREGISLQTQKKFQIGYDIESQRITIPIRTPYCELAAVKGRCNYEPGDYEPKYLYLQPGPMSQLLYGYCENYDGLLEGDIKIFESEKSVLLCDSFGIHDCVALGSNSLSPTQCKLILSLNPKSVTFLLDNNLPLENTKRNVDLLKSYCKMRELPIRYYDWTSSISLPEKAAPVDYGKETYEYILNNEIKNADELYNDV